MSAGRFNGWAAVLVAVMVMVMASAAFAQDLPKIAVYVTGNVGADEKEALGTRILTSLVNSGRYMAIERSNAFLAEIDKEHIKQRSGAIDDSQISELGKQFGVKFVCIAAITPAFGDYQVSARIVDVETAVVVFIGESASPLKSMADLARVSDQVVKNMFGGQTTPELQHKPPADEPSARYPVDGAIQEGIGAQNVASVRKKRNYDDYFTWRYLPIASPIYWCLPAYNVELGSIWRNGMFLGVDLGFVGDIHSLPHVVGGGFNFGKSFELAHDFNLAFGGSLGLWFNYPPNSGGFYWIGPFVRLRYNIFEVSYRVLFGTEERDDGSYDSYGYYNASSGLGATNQVGVGLYLEGTSKRFGQSRYDYYFAFRYLPITSPVYWELLAYDIEAGWVWGDGMSFGIDFGLALEDSRGHHIGGGFNFGKSFELPNDFNLALGGSLGLWFTTGREKVRLEYFSEDYYDNVNSFLFLGPFVRLRYSIFELSYRALFGDKKPLSSDIGFSNQFGIGFYFEGKKRHR